MSAPPIRSLLLALPLLLATAACGSEESGGAPGVDLENKVVRVGLLNDLSGPAAVIGRAINLGIKIRYQEVNAGGILPEGWTIVPVERDHGYNPQQSVQLYNEVYEDVLFLGMSFGTPTTLPLQPMLARDNMIAIPASLSSRTGRNEYTPIFTASYRTEAMRTVDWAVEQGGADVRVGIIYNQDDFGMDALEGLEVEAAYHGIEVASKQPIAPGQADFTAPVSALQAAGAEYVVLGILGGATSPILGTANQLGYEPVWVGNTPAWLDQYFDPEVVPPEVFENFHVVTSLPFWGEERPGMAEFLEAYEKYGRAQSDPDWWILLGYVIGAAGVEATRIAMESGELSREGLLSAMHQIDGWDLRGLLEPVSLTTVPYLGGTETRIQTPILAERTWEVVADLAAPQSGLMAPSGG
jgi:ABC-type branched-subunit amino acid transport system substrate-binding protein